MAPVLKGSTLTFVWSCFDTCRNPPLGYPDVISSSKLKAHLLTALFGCSVFTEGGGKKEWLLKGSDLLMSKHYPEEHVPCQAWLSKSKRVSQTPS